jgi:hypothetical protein
LAEQDIGPLPFDKEFCQRLYRHLVDTGRFDKAYHVADFPNVVAKGNHDRSLLEDLLRQPNLPDLTRADALIWHSDLLSESGEIDHSMAQRNEAEALFQKKGHAYGVLMIQIARCSSTQSISSVAVRKKTLLRIKHEMEDIGQWFGVRKSMNGLYELAIETSDEELMLELDREFDRIRPICMSPLEWVGHATVNFHRWSMSGLHTAKMLPSIESLYSDFEKTDVPQCLVVLASLLSKAYSKLGDTTKAAEWEAKIVETLPKLHVARKLFSEYSASLLYKLKEIGKHKQVPHFNEEFAQLKVFLDELRVEVEKHPPVFERWVTFLQVMNVAVEYEAQHTLRPFQSTKTLVQYCLDTGEAILQNLAPREALFGVSTLLRHTGFLRGLEALQVVPPDRVMVRDSKDLYHKALDKAKEGKDFANIVTVSNLLGHCYQLLWKLELSPDKRDIDPTDFLLADRYFNAASAAFAGSGFGSERRKCVQYLHQLWLLGSEHHLKLPL